MSNAYIERELELLKLTNNFTPKTLNRINRSIWIDKQDLLILKKKAEGNDTSVSREIREAIKKYIEDDTD